MLQDDARPPLPRIILDTNVVLDWMLFGDARFAELSQSLERGQLTWLATAAMREELSQVLQRGHLDRWKPDTAGIMSRWRLHCVEVSTPSATWASPIRLRCSDPADQMFIDLAVAHRVEWLLSRDRAVLKLRRRLLSLGIQVATPDAWHKAGSAATGPISKKRATEVAL